MILVDTNLLLHAVNVEAPQHGRSFRVLRQLANGSDKWALTWGTLYEFLRVATHPRVFPAPLTFEQAWSAVRGWIGLPTCVVVCETPLHAEIVEQCRAESPRLAGNRVHDFHAAVLMREHAVSGILTLDEDFRAFP